MRFKVGDRVRTSFQVNDSWRQFKNKIVKVVRVDRGFLYFKNDKNHGYSGTRFKIAHEKLYKYILKNE